MIRIETRKLEPLQAEFLIRGISAEMANALRRCLLAEVPKMAIEDVEFHLGTIREGEKEYESYAPLFDEIIAHRLGMLPVPTDLALYKFREECTCKGVGCPTCSIKYTLHKAGRCVVRSGDLVPFGGDEKLRICDPNIPIVELGEDQALSVEATAVLGRGKEHAKWQAAQAVAYKNVPIITLDEKLCDGCGECVRVCHRRIFRVGKGGKAVELQETQGCDFCGECANACPRACLNVAMSESDFFFSFETDGALHASTAFAHALRILLERTKEFERALRECTRKKA
jgi:DNA-directed RNA polymerase subunit D